MDKSTHNFSVMMRENFAFQLVSFEPQGSHQHAETDPALEGSTTQSLPYHGLHVAQMHLRDAGRYMGHAAKHIVTSRCQNLGLKDEGTATHMALKRVSREALCNPQYHSKCDT
eukprot:1146063-Pelagomonas_calceolata.AAC.9